MSIGNRQGRLIAGLILLTLAFACDSPPWSQCIVANETQTEMTVRFSTAYSMFSDACVYSPEDWSSGSRSCTPGTEIRGSLADGRENKWLEAVIPPGGALELTRYRYPDIEENVSGSFLIDGLEITGSAGSVSWTGRKEIFGHLKREVVPFWYLTGNTPRYVYYYK